jgi:asparagine N-glycosylation enzyme membrane subunit Stt3
MSDDSININIGGIKEGFGKLKSFFSQKKVLNVLFIIFFLAILITGSWIRTQNLPLLVDSTTGEYIPTALDPFYFLRLSETLLAEGSLPEFDTFRQPFDVGFSKEIMPRAVVSIFSVWKIFDSNVSLQYINVISPVIFFILGLIAFFFLIQALTRSKFAALISSAFLVIVPAYIYRTAAGFSDHESIGMFAFFLALLIYTLAMKFLDKEHPRKKILLKSVLFGVLLGLASSFTITSWGGIASFLFVIIPLSFGLFWLGKSQERYQEYFQKRKFQSYLAFYISWVVFTILSAVIFYGYGLKDTLSRVSFGSTSILTGALLLFIIIDFVLLGRKNLLKHDLRKYRVIVSFVLSIFLGILVLFLMGNSSFSIISGFLDRLLHPFGTDRISLTVAENSQPFLNDWVNQISKTFFWLFLGGLVTLGLSISGALKKHKDKILFSLLWILFIFGILFSRISPSSLFNGTNSISKLFYFGSSLLLIAYLVRLYFREKINLRAEYFIMFSWAIFMLISVRSAVRTFFLTAPFTCFSVGLLITNLSRYVKKSKDDLLRLSLGVLLIVVIVLSLISFNGLSTSTIDQAKNTGPSANFQWQQSMEWVRDNTPADSVFVHWWDYGYWVQYLGQRPTLADGGHFQGSFRDHLIGRYLLTTPNPETAMSFMKTNDVSYLLIDPTDLGKYGAYSRIGSDESGEDRFSQIQTMLLDPAQTQKTSESETRFYRGGVPVDEDIIYQGSEGEIFLPSNNAGVGGIVLNFSGEGLDFKINSAFVIFIYNNQQINIPLKHVYAEGRLFEFETGLDAAARIIPSVSLIEQNVQVDRLGSVIYLSPKVSKSLFARLYLLDDVFNDYPSMKVAHSTLDPFVSSLNAQGADLGEIAYFQGFRGPIKIWETNFPENVLEKEEFLRTRGDLAEFDDLQFLV